MPSTSVQALGTGPHDLLFEDVTVDGRGYLASAFHFYHSDGSHPNASNVTVRRLTVTGTQQAIILWDDTLRDIVFDTADITGALSVAVRYEADGSGIRFANIVSTGSGAGVGFYSSQGSSPSGVTFEQQQLPVNGAVPAPADASRSVAAARRVHHGAPRARVRGSSPSWPLVVWSAAWRRAMYVSPAASPITSQTCFRFPAISRNIAVVSSEAIMARIIRASGPQPGRIASGSRNTASRIRPMGPTSASVPITRLCGALPVAVYTEVMFAARTTSGV